jgi:nitroimidazol reductase NimA-like FMN-containing flavoprotein (pyridoxamine 5'-phosphate oxidase superfamily)
MYIRTVKSRGHEYVQLAHNYRDPETGASKAKVLYNFGRKDQLDVEGLKRLAGSIARFLEQYDAACFSVEDSEPVQEGPSLPGLTARIMRRSRQSLSEEETKAVLARGQNGVLACLGDGGYPYAVPLSYVYLNGRIYFHSAKEGHKIDAITGNPKVSFAVIDEDTIVSEEYTSYFRSAIVFGRARVADGEERQEAFRALVDKYAGDRPEEERSRTAAECERACIVAIDIDHVTGKEARELVEKRSGDAVF